MHANAHFVQGSLYIYAAFFLMGKPLCQNASESYFHALHDVTTGRAQSHGFRGWTGNGDARNAHRSAAQNGNGSGRETGGSLVSSSPPPPSSSSNISGRHGQRNPDLSGGPGILSLDLRNTSAAFFPIVTVSFGQDRSRRTVGCFATVSAYSLFILAVACDLFLKQIH